jgi:hypothetical protein
VEGANPADDLLLDLGLVLAGLRNLDEKGGGWSSWANDDALLDQMLAVETDVVLDSPLINSQILGSSVTGMIIAYLVSQRKLFSDLIQSSFLPRGE